MNNYKTNNYIIIKDMLEAVPQSFHVHSHSTVSKNLSILSTGRSFYHSLELVKYTKYMHPGSVTTYVFQLITPCTILSIGKRDIIFRCMLLLF